MDEAEKTTGQRNGEPLIFDIGSADRGSSFLPEATIEESVLSKTLPSSMIRDTIDGFPEISEPEIVRHYTRLSQCNYSVDTGMYPLGSCTMKYNPKVNETAAALPGFSQAHPLLPDALSQGALNLMHNLETYVAEITGLDRVTLQPSAGAQGELTAMMMIRAYFRDRGEKRSKVIIPDTAHGTNPASVSMCGFEAITVKSSPCGMLEAKTVMEVMDENVAAIMITNPNTLGIFECNAAEIADVVHGCGGLIYMDGANLNALMGIVRFGDIGCDLAHVNLHKTFSTPHGGGGPGSGPLAVKEFLAPYLPIPIVEQHEGSYRLNYDLPQTIGKVRSFYGNFLVCVRAYAYIRSLGEEGLKHSSVSAVLNANYIRSKLEKHYHLPYETPSLHECVLNDRKQKQYGVTTLDIAKRLIDYGFHPPTIYFPLVVDGALMIEPTETESRETLDQFIEAMLAIAEESKRSPEMLRRAPVTAGITRVDEVAAARKPVLRWKPAG